MDRRQFLLASAASLVATPALAEGMMGMNGMHGMHDMSAMGHGGSRTPAVLPEGLAFQEPVRLANMSTQPGVFEATLEAGPATAEIIPGIQTPILVYNGSSPGPLIEVTEGDRVKIRFSNKIPGEDSTIHWHGLTIAEAEDGSPMRPVASGSDTVYEFTVPDGTAGTYWYHPHPHGITAAQVYRGLAGTFLVKPKQDPIPPDYGDTILVITDLRLDADGTMPASDSMDEMNGRVGDHILINGLKNPELMLQAGETRRFRLYNATNARYLNLSFSDLPFTIIGTDGGLLEKPVPEQRSLLLTPGERLEILVTFNQPGRFMLTTLDYDRGWMGMGKPDDAGIDILTVTAGSDVVMPTATLPEELRQLPDPGTATLTRRFELGESMSMGLGGMKMAFMINGESFDMARFGGTAKTGDVEIWEVVNTTDMDHPFHVHGLQFQVLDFEKGGIIRNPDYRALKDTVNVARGETVRLILTHEHPGPRMYHCHILEHEDLGMMGMIDVRPA